MFWCNHFCSVFVVVVLEEKLPPTVKIRKKSTARLLFRQLRIAYTVMMIIGHKHSLLGVQKMATAYTLAMQFMIRKTYLVLCIASAKISKRVPYINFSIELLFMIGPLYNCSGIQINILFFKS